jgi:hypothetical protein
MEPEVVGMMGLRIILRRPGQATHQAAVTSSAEVVANLWDQEQRQLEETEEAAILEGTAREAAGTETIEAADLTTVELTGIPITIAAAATEMGVITMVCLYHHHHYSNNHQQHKCH